MQDVRQWKNRNGRARVELIESRKVRWEKDEGENGCALSSGSDLGTKGRFIFKTIQYFSNPGWTMV